jgi:hypothetical protein
LITNTQNSIGYTYDEKEKKFVAIDKNQLLERIIVERTEDISSFHELLEDKLDDKTKKMIDKYIDKINNDEEFMDFKKKDIKLIIYNNRDKVLSKGTQELEIVV